ncbi:hypothetical protein SAMN05880501_105123 [Ureibacillus xyleni]|uniref:DUF5658 domain-containing protein n=1 Tax=Ureibacillus xyleni TaxID=614648 RepID=A0A285SLP9_9BACL|nr:DUF5658 family protein [Ureibacillus xyleni]SOC08686.1 hypothetical protein SAMN05880501_105123 [Ureibacillus xyleni]
MERKSWVVLLGVLVALLNVFDGIATNFGLMNDFIDELNPIMNSIFSASPVFFVCLKLGLSLLIIYVSFLVYKNSKDAFQNIYIIALVGVSCMYVGIFGLHVFWISQL